MLDSVFALLAVSHGVLSDGKGAGGDAYASPFYDIYETADGRYLALGAIRAQSSRSSWNVVSRPCARGTHGSPVTTLSLTPRPMRWYHGPIVGPSSAASTRASDSAS